MTFSSEFEQKSHKTHEPRGSQLQGERDKRTTTCSGQRTAWRARGRIEETKSEDRAELKRESYNNSRHKHIISKTNLHHVLSWLVNGSQRLVRVPAATQQ